MIKMYTSSKRQHVNAFARHDKLSTREWVHRGDIVALHMVQRSLRSCLRAAMSGGHHGLLYV